jgi:DNA polymerase-1
MERKGVLVDTKALALLHKRIQPELERIQRETFMPLGVNPASPKQLKQLLDLDATGEEELVEALKRGHSKALLIKQLLRYRKLAKVDSVYLVGVYHRLEDSRIHTHFKIEGTETGRLSSQDPNLQNVPNEMRVIYVADPGKVMVEADYNQLELRVLAVVAQEQTAIQELFYEDKNTHHMIGKIIYHRDWDQLTVEEKLRAKAVVFGTAYGRSARSIAVEFGISTLEAERWQALCINRYPGFLTYRQRQEQLLSRGEPIRTPFGRKRVVSGLTQALNTPIQSAAADVTLTSLIELDKAGIDLRLTVHDSIVAEFAVHEVQEGIVLIKRVMERPVEQLGGFSFPAKIKTGPNWANVKEVKL